MNLDELRAFIAVVETGSFSGAAKSLNFARATLRRRIDELEARTGVELLRRTADGASVTRAGEMLAERGRTILSETKDLLSAVRGLDATQERIALELPFGQPPEMEIAAHNAFRTAAPKIRWEIRYSDGVFRPESDSTIVIHLAITEPSFAPGWRHLPVGNIPIGLLAAPEYLAKNGEPKAIEDLASHPLIVWENAAHNPEELPLKNGDLSPEIDPQIITRSAYMARRLAQANQGIALAPSLELPAFLDPMADLAPVLKDEVGTQVRLWVSSKEDNQAGFGVLLKALVHFSRSIFGVKHSD